MKNKTLLVLFVSILLLCSCGVNRVYTPASYGNLKSYTAKPIYKDTITKSNYISLSLISGKHPHEENKVNHIKGLGSFYSSKNIEADTKFMASVNYHTSSSYKKSNFYYGVGLNYGSYKFKTALDNVIEENETQSFFIFNPKIGGSLKHSTAKLDYHFIGLEFNYHYESGSYLKQLSKITPSNSVIVVNEKSLLSYNLFSELLLKINSDNTFGLGLFVGGILGLNETKYNITNNEGKGFGGLTFSYRHKKITFSIVAESGARKVQSINYGLSYQF